MIVAQSMTTFDGHSPEVGEHPLTALREAQRGSNPPA
jgi:hypothetical protein